MDKEQLIKATQILQKYEPNRFPLKNQYIEAMQEYAEWYYEEQSKKCSIPTVSGSLPLTLKPVKKLKRGDVFLWRSGMTGRYEIHTFHSDAGYGVKTFTDYNEKDGSSMLVNWSGVCGVLVGTDR